MNDDATTDLGWLAFQYTIDELAPADALAFEARLADDQRAREALAEAVLLSHALARSAPRAVPAASARRQFASSLIWAVCGAAACLAVISAMRFSADVQRQPIAAPPLQPGRDEALAQAWFSARLPDLSNDALSADVVAEDDIGLAGGEADALLSVPVWMLEAVQDVPNTTTDNERKES